MTEWMSSPLAKRVFAMVVMAGVQVGGFAGWMVATVGLFVGMGYGRLFVVVVVLAGEAGVLGPETMVTFRNGSIRSPPQGRGGFMQSSPKQRPSAARARRGWSW